MLFWNGASYLGQSPSILHGREGHPGKRTRCQGAKQEYPGHLAGPFPTEVTGGFQSPLLKGNWDTFVDISVACGLHFA